MGNGEIRKIASGLQGFVSEERLNGAMVCVLANLKEKKLGGFPSHGMVMCGETPNKSAVELIDPPKGAKVGDLIHIEGEDRTPPE
mgnify:CR=1 FL=1